MLRQTLLLALIFLNPSLLAQITQSLNDQTKPLYEFGAVMVGAIVPAYPGSDTQNTFFLPIPFPTFFYRGDILRADEEGGMRSRFFKSDTFEINLSVGGSLPADSKDVKAREGMPNLDTIAEFGPGLLATLWTHKNKDFSYKLGLNIPLRVAFGLDFWRVRQHGLIFNPLLYFISEGFIGKRIITFTGLSSVYASQRFHRLFYQVDSIFATPQRPSYSAQSGYMSTTVSQGLSTRFTKNTAGFLGLSYTNLKGNVNKSSPLFIREDNFSAALGFIWWFHKSDARAKK